jgi:tripartite-type tricarboxylate transporter receptor subunit TctC
MQFASMPATIQFVRGGKLRMIAQAGKTRSGAAPEVPTMIESGLPDYVISSGFALFGPAGLPRPIVDRANAVLKSALANPAVRSQLADQGAEAIGSTPEEHDQFNRAEIAKWIKVARDANILPE